MGGWAHNEWIRGMIWHHEFLLCWYIGYMEIKHFSFMFGPKFSAFYNTYTKYECKQMVSQWADTVEDVEEVVDDIDTNKTAEGGDE